MNNSISSTARTYNGTDDLTTKVALKNVQNVVQDLQISSSTETQHKSSLSAILTLKSARIIKINRSSTALDVHASTKN